MRKNPVIRNGKGVTKKWISNQLKRETLIFIVALRGCLTFFFSPSRLRIPLLESEGMNFKIDVVLGLAVEVERQEHRWMGLERRVMSVRVQMLYLK